MVSSFVRSCQGYFVYPRKNVPATSNQLNQPKSLLGPSQSWCMLGKSEAALCEAIIRERRICSFFRVELLIFSGGGASRELPARASGAPSAEASAAIFAALAALAFSKTSRTLAEGVDLGEACPHKVLRSLVRSFESKRDQSKTSHKHQSLPYHSPQFGLAMRSVQAWDPIWGRYIVLMYILAHLTTHQCTR